MTTNYNDFDFYYLVPGGLGPTDGYFYAVRKSDGLVWEYQQLYPPAWAAISPEHHNVWEGGRQTKEQFEEYRVQLCESVRPASALEVMVTIGSHP